MVTRPGALPLLRNLTNLMSVWASTSSTSSCALPTSNKILMIILYELVDVIEVTRIKMFTLYAEVPFERFGKELRFVSVCTGDFVVLVQCWIIALTLWLEEVHDFALTLAWIGL